MSLPTKGPLSGGANGRLIMIGGVASGAGTTLHTAAAGAVTTDYVTIKAVNTDTLKAHVLTLEKIGTGQANQIPISVPPNVGFITVTDRMALQSALLLTGFCADGSQLINVDGWFDRY